MPRLLRDRFMSAYTFSDLNRHVGHRIECVNYGDPPVNASVECMDCNEVILDFDKADEQPLPKAKGE
jgi:hypothetical protein